MKKLFITLTLLFILAGSAFAEKVQTVKKLGTIEYTVEWDDEAFISGITDWTWGYIYATLQNKYDVVQTYKAEECEDCDFQRFGIKYTKMFGAVEIYTDYSYTIFLNTKAGIFEYVCYNN